MERNSHDAPMNLELFLLLAWTQGGIVCVMFKSPRVRAAMLHDGAVETAK